MRCASGGVGPPWKTRENGARPPGSCEISVTSTSSTSNAGASSSAIGNRSPRSGAKSAAVTVSRGRTSGPYRCESSARSRTCRRRELRSARATGIERERQPRGQPLVSPPLALLHHLLHALFHLLPRLAGLLLNAIDDVVRIVARFVHVALRDLTEFLHEPLLQLRRALANLLLEHVV